MMTTRTLQILLALADGPLHGYGIKQSVEDRTGGEVRLGSGTLYETVHRLVGRGEIEEVDPPPDEPPTGGPPRRYYALTRTGRQTLREELRRLEAVVRYARGRNLLGDAPAP
jgi:DNA-binding PadR family transcriptional regulator